MPRTPEQDALTKNWATINSALANQVDLTEFGNFLVQHEFLPQQSVNNILSGGQNFTKLTSLTRGVQSRIVTASSPSRTAQYYKSFVLLVHDDLHLTGLAQEMVDACKYFYDQRGLQYQSPLVAEVPVPASDCAPRDDQHLRPRQVTSTTTETGGEAENREEKQHDASNNEHGRRKEGVIANIKSSCGVVVAAGVVAAAAVVLLFLGAYGAYYQLHINVQGVDESSKKEWNIPPPSLTVLSKELKEIGDWVSLCNYLGVERAIMEKIKFSGTKTPKDECLNAYLDGGNASWKHVVSVICTHPFYKMVTGRKIAKKYNVPDTECNKNG